MRLGRRGLTLGIAVAGMLFIAGRSDARVCQGTSEISGPYGFTASRFGLVGSPQAFTGAFTGTAVTPTGTTGGTSTGTATGTGGTSTGAAAKTPSAALTGVGGLVTGAAAGEPFARTGSLFADGNGNLFLNAAGVPQVQFGTYTVDADCGVTMKLNNNFAFGSTTGATDTGTGTDTDTGMGAGTATGTGTGTGTGTAAGTASPLTQASKVTFSGAVVEQGGEIDLVQTGSVGGTTMTLKRTATFKTCGQIDLNGDYGIVGSGTNIFAASTGAAATGITLSPFAIAGRLTADGNGGFTTDAFPTSTSAASQLSGTYTVNTDCTGTAKVTGASGAANTLNFVLVRENRGGAAFPRPDVHLLFSISGTGVTGSGIAQPQ